MVQATILRGNTSVSLDLIADGGTPLVSRDIGRPSLQFQQNGELLPRHIDHYSGLETYTLLGRFFGSNAYSNANTLADLLKSNPNGTPLTLNIGMPEYDTDMTVMSAAGQEQAVELNYPPGKKDTVEIDVGLTRVSDSLGGTDQAATTPTAAGSGPVQLSDDNNTVDLVEDIGVSRTVGRPQDQAKKAPDTAFPRMIAKTKSAYEAFEISLQFNSDTVTTINNLADMFNQKLRRDSLTLNFNGQYGLGSFDVVPDGSGALRHVRESGKKNTMIVPTINLRRVRGTN